MEEITRHWHTLLSNSLTSKHMTGVDVISQLQERLCHQTALYCSKLVKSEEGDAGECCEELHTSLDNVAELLGQLIVVRPTYQGLQLHTQTTPTNKLHPPCQWPATLDKVGCVEKTVEDHVIVVFSVFSVLV